MYCNYTDVIVSSPNLLFCYQTSLEKDSDISKVVIIINDVVQICMTFTPNVWKFFPLSILKVRNDLSTLVIDMTMVGLWT